jgi:hypothetical protein
MEHIASILRVEKWAKQEFSRSGRQAEQSNEKQQTRFCPLRLFSPTAIQKGWVLRLSFLNSAQLSSTQLSMPTSACFLLGLLFDSEDGGDIFPRKFGLSPNYTVLQPEGLTVHSHYRKGLRSNKKLSVDFEALTAAVMERYMFWGITPWRWRRYVRLPPNVDSYSTYFTALYPIK